MAEPDFFYGGAQKNYSKILASKKSILQLIFYYFTIISYFYRFLVNFETFMGGPWSTHPPSLLIPTSAIGENLLMVEK